MAVDYEAMTNPELRAYFEEHNIPISPSLSNELGRVRAVTDDPKTEIAHDKAVVILRGRESRSSTRRANLISAASFVVAAAALVVAIISLLKN